MGSFGLLGQLGGVGFGVWGLGVLKGFYKGSIGVLSGLGVGSVLIHGFVGSLRRAQYI